MGLNTSIKIKFQYSFESKCFQLISNAYNNAIADKVIKLDWDENDITSELHNYIDINPLRLKWEVSTNVEYHLLKKELKKRKGFAAKLPRIDLRLSTFNSFLEHKYFFEKRLKEKSSKLKRRYIDTGIDSFISKKYENGSLIGYLVEGNLDVTVDGINSLLTKDKRKIEILKYKFLKYHSNYYESEHKEIGVLKHLIFDFTDN